MNKVVVHCHHCGKELEVTTRKFNFNNKMGYNFYCENCNNIGRRKRVERICPVCGKKFERLLSGKTSKSGLYFCSQSCAVTYNNSHYRTGENNPNWIDGSHKGQSYIKKAFRTYKHRCVMCGLEEECCLQVHHIDENRSNDSVENLIILCANCHSRIHRGNYKITEEILRNREVV